MKLFLLICLTLLFVTCSGDDQNNTCSIDDPVKDLPWLKTIIESSHASPADLTVEQGTFFSRTVFIINPCCPTCFYTDFANTITPVYNCEGEMLKDLSSADKNITNRKVIWKTPAEEAECW